MESPATGQQHELRWGAHRAVVVELGAGLRRYSYAGRDVVDGYGADETPEGARGQVLVPWPNRIRDGRYRWDGADHQTVINEPAAGNAIHGLVRGLPFALRAQQESVRQPWGVTLGTTLSPQPGYPFRLDIEVEYAVGPDGLAVSITARNTGGSDAPYAAGQHPYLTVGTDSVDDAWLSVPADRCFQTDERGTPVSDAPVADTPYDFRRSRVLGGTRLDTAFVGLRRDAAGRAVVRLANPADGSAVELWLDRAADYLQVYTADTAADPSARRRSLAVEPMSAPANAFRSGLGLVRLRPSGTHRLGWGISPRPGT